MPWEDRIREAAYTGPSGVRQTFIFEDVSLEITKRTSAYDFPDADGTFVQDLGKTGRRYPLRCIFSGNDHDLEADSFMSLLGEKGLGVLEHPFYGPVNVVPFGVISRVDPLRSAANQTLITVAFWETIEVLFPTVQESPSDGVVSTLDEFNDAAALDYEADTDLTSVPKQVTALGRLRNLIDSTKARLQAVADVTTAVQKQFNAIFDSIATAIDVLILTPLTMIQQMVLLVQSPARAFARINARLDAYKNLADLTIKNVEGVFNIYSPDANNKNSNDFHADDTFTAGYLSGAILSVVNNQFDTATQAIEAADQLVTQFEEWVDWRDQNYESLGEIDTGAAYQKMQKALSQAVGFLIQISFTLKQERSILITSAMTIIEFAAEFYGNIDDETLNFIIDSNNLGGFPGILEIEAGTVMLYYV